FGAVAVEILDDHRQVEERFVAVEQIGFLGRPELPGRHARLGVDERERLLEGPLIGRCEPWIGQQVDAVGGGVVIDPAGAHQVGEHVQAAADDEQLVGLLPAAQSAADRDPLL
ncbi:MAG: hypothetical protein ACK56I_09175, partial [bacterium]